MKVAIYARVSTEEQAKEGYSIDAQKQRLTDFARSQGWDIYDFYIDDGYSAKDLDRPNVQRMIADIKARKFDVVLVYRLDRLVRSVINLHELLILFDENNVKFRSSTEMFDTTSAMGRFFITLVGAMAQWERENLAERVRMGMMQKHSEGGRNGAVAPYGYDIVDGQLVVNQAEAAVVRRIFDLYKMNKSTRAISKQFNSEGVPKRETRYWSDNSVYYIITNPVYCGKLRWNYRKLRGDRTGEEVIVDGSHDPIISVEEFDDVQRMRELRAREGKRVTNSFAFTGVLRCGRCGYAMHGKSRETKTGRKRSYKCLGRFNYGVCDMPLIAEESVFEAYAEFIDVKDLRKLASMVKVADNAQEVAETEKLRVQLERELEGLQKKKNRWFAAYENEVISAEELKEKTADIRAKEDYYLSEVSKLSPKQKSRKTPAEVLERLSLLSYDWATPSVCEEDEVAKKQFLQEVYSEIVINTDVVEAKGGPGRKVPVYITHWVPN